MPEGPEIRRAADQLAKVLAGQRIVHVELGLAHLESARSALEGAKVVGVRPRSKAMLTHFDSGVTVVSHNQLYGEWAIYRRHREPSTTRQRRLVLHTVNHSAVLYSASDIVVMPTDQIEQHPYIRKLGLELLDPAVTVAQVRLWIDRPAFAGRALWSLLLDQSFLAGVGNYLRSEILFTSGLTPWVKLKALTAEQRHTLASQALKITRQAYRQRGVTIALPKAKSLRAQGWSYAQYRHWVFDRVGEPCHVCGTTLARIDPGGRAIVWCKSCQKG
jgi:endonuclease-8